MCFRRASKFLRRPPRTADLGGRARGTPALRNVPGTFRALIGTQIGQSDRMAYGGRVSRAVATTVGTVVAIAAFGGCSAQDCIKPGPSGVELRLTRGIWELSEFALAMNA